MFVVRVEISYSSDAKAEGLSGARNSVAKKKKWWKKKSSTTTSKRYDLYYYQFCTCQTIYFLSFWPFSPSFNLQKLFLMFSTTPIYPKDILRNFFSNKMFFDFILFFFSICFFLIFFLSVSILLLVFAFFWQNKQKKLQVKMSSTSKF